MRQAPIGRAAQEVLDDKFLADVRKALDKIRGTVAESEDERTEDGSDSPGKPDDT